MRLSISWSDASELQEMIPSLCNLEKRFPGLENLECEFLFCKDKYILSLLDKFVASELVKSIIKPSKLKILINITNCNVKNFKNIVDTLVESPLIENLKLSGSILENGTCIFVSLWENFLEISLGNRQRKRNGRDKVTKILESIAPCLKKIPKSILILQDMSFYKHFAALEALEVKTFKTIKLHNCNHEPYELYDFVFYKCGHVNTLKVEDFGNGDALTHVFIERELECPSPKLKTLHVYGPKYTIEMLAEIMQNLGQEYGNNVFNDVNILICSVNFTIKKEAKGAATLTAHKYRQRDPSWDDSLYRMNICLNPMCDIDAVDTDAHDFNDWSD